MTVLISTTNTNPFQQVDYNRLADQLTIDGTSGMTTVEMYSKLYFVFTSGTFENVSINVENEVSSGVSLYISLLDIIDSPLHWGKQIILTNIDVDTSGVPVVIPFKYKWVAVNNIYILTQQHVAGTINVYNIS